MISALRLAAIFIVAALSNAFGWEGYHPEAWTSVRLATPEVVRLQAVTNGPFIFTNYYPQWNTVITNMEGLIYTNYVYGWPPDGECSTNKSISTNEFLSDIVANGGTLETGAVVNTWFFRLYNCTGGAYEVSRTVTNFPTWTNLSMQAQDIMAFDSHMAAYERWLTSPNDRPLTKPRFYRNTRDTLVATKEWVLENYPHFVSTNWTFPDYLIDPIPWMDLRTLTTQSHVPSNYCTFTPWRWLGPVAGGLGNVVGGQWRMVGKYNTNGIALIQTNITVNSCGQTVTNIGAYTNGQIVSFICTNDQIAVGFQESDYGFRHLQAVFSNLTRVGYEGNYVGAERRYERDGEVGIDLTGTGEDVFARFASIWRTQLSSEGSDHISSVTGVFDRVYAKYQASINYAGAVVEYQWVYRTSSNLYPALLLPKPLAITTQIERVYGYAYAEMYVKCFPEDPDPCSPINAPGPGIAPMLINEASTCFTNNIPKKTPLSHEYVNTIGVFTNNNPHPNGNTLVFLSPVTPPQPVYTAREMPLTYAGYLAECYGLWEGAWRENGLSQYTIPYIFVDWRFAR